MWLITGAVFGQRAFSGKQLVNHVYRRDIPIYIYIYVHRCVILCDDNK